VRGCPPRGGHIPVRRERGLLLELAGLRLPHPAQSLVRWDSLFRMAEKPSNSRVGPMGSFLRRNRSATVQPDARRKKSSLSLSLSLSLLRSPSVGSVPVTMATRSGLGDGSLCFPSATPSLRPTAGPLAADPLLRGSCQRSAATGPTVRGEVFRSVQWGRILWGALACFVGRGSASCGEGSVPAPIAALHGG
jgi:hypothetical protein